ncbi:GAF domain-containing protein [Nocardia sp.]|uniref:GAF domain-containing protein n=1 Tax=Nocardia sp. TaxID=1821 RepID=UPI002613318F|nr:GAF domain-containing protein [Nocardia sp.]
MVERLGDTNDVTVLVDGQHPRRFANLNRVTIATNIVIARRLPPLVERCAVSRRVAIDQLELACGASINIVASPICGPYGHVRAVALWAGDADEGLPPLPNIGVLEWDATVVVSASASARSLLLDDQKVERLMLPEMLSYFDRFEDRSQFLALLSFDSPIDEWIGCATRTFGDGVVHRLHLAARASGMGTNRTVRAVVCDISDVEAPVPPDMYSSALRNVPVLRGHALALIDLNGLVIHDWVANDHDRIAGWSHHRPLLHPDDQAAILSAGLEMLSGTATTASVRARVRFDSADDWIQLESWWTRIVTGDQPQVLADIAIVPPMPASVLDKCSRCQGISDEAA